MGGARRELYSVECDHKGMQISISVVCKAVPKVNFLKCLGALVIKERDSQVDYSEMDNTNSDVCQNKHNV